MPKRHVLDLALTTFTALGLCLTGCSSDKSSNPGDDTSGIGEGYLILGSFQSLYEDQASLEVIVTRWDVGDPAANLAAVSFDGNDVPMRSLFSNAESAVYLLEGFDYTVGKTYALSVSLGGESANCSFVAPVFDYPVISQPVDDGLFTPGNALTVAWGYDGNGGTPDQVFLAASPVSSQDENVYYEKTLSGSSNSYEIPGTETATWSDDEVLVTVDLGEKVWSFQGSLASAGSSVAAVLPGDAVIIRNSHGGSGADYSMSASIYPSSIAADGVSSADLSIVIFDQDSGAPCPDGTMVVVTASPQDRVSLGSGTATTSGGTATITTTAGSSTGPVTFTVSAPNLDAGLEASAVLTLTEPDGNNGYDITVGTGTHPTIDWSPADGMATVLVTPASLDIEDALWSIGRRVVGGSWITPTVTFGTTPSGASQLVPLQGEPAGLVPGTSYKVWLVTQLGVVHSETFVP
ncbi:MAG: hypothetical protein R3E97_06065 [Candidatus Eisenbacteria bacterium]